PLWDRMRTMELPEPLQLKVDAWRAQGELVRYEWETFQDPSWLSMYAGFDVHPRRYNVRADQFDTDELRATFDRMRAAVADTVRIGVPGGDFVTRLRR
ncbi:MAG TPA: tryptophan 7-halogenase, partial [Sphingomonas sp.]|nr:tryptophan 7-halogenase [Sphingomonas sp.]